MVTTTRPTLAAASKQQEGQSGTCMAHMAMWSPWLSPRAISPRATESARSPSVKHLVRHSLAELSPVFDTMYAELRRPSIRPGRLLKASLLMSPGLYILLAGIV